LSEARHAVCCDDWGMEAAKKAARLARSLTTAPCPTVNGGVFVFFAVVVAGALVSACWMSTSARVRSLPLKTLVFHGTNYIVAPIALSLDTYEKG
jgi:L-alanine-DL-glutamate epimerase-like enolase superfamily enzyme